MLTRFLDYLFPKTSLRGLEGEWVTEQELAALRTFPIVAERAMLCREGIVHLDRLVAGSSYRKNPLLKKAVWTMKFKRVPALSESLARVLLQGARGIHAHDAVLVPVPLHWSRHFHRGFNQAALFSTIVSAKRDLPVRHLLVRKHATGYQSHRSRSDRRTALRGAFSVRTPIHSRIILIDDVATTGATLDACAAVLKMAGAEWVEGWVVAKG